jgi:hypothetical protein
LGELIVSKQRGAVVAGRAFFVMAKGRASLTFNDNYSLSSGQIVRIALRWGMIAEQFARLPQANGRAWEVVRVCKPLYPMQLRVRNQRRHFTCYF